MRVYADVVRRGGTTRRGLRVSVCFIAVLNCAMAQRVWSRINAQEPWGGNLEDPNTGGFESLL